MTVNVKDVLKVLNMTAEELEEGVISLQITSATIRVDALNKGFARGPIVDEAKLRLAAYLTYLAYVDDPKNRLPGTIDSQTGQFIPVGDPASRVNIEAKLKALKTQYDEALAAMSESVDSPTGMAPAFGALRFK